MSSSSSLHPGEVWCLCLWTVLFDSVPGHCKKLKPDWDKLMDEFNGSPGSLVADVDCTAEGQSLCEKHEAARCKKHLEGVAALH